MCCPPPPSAPRASRPRPCWRVRRRRRHHFHRPLPPRPASADTRETPSRRLASTACTSSSAPTRPMRSWSRGTRCSRFPVRRVLLGGPDGRYGRSFHAETVSYTDGKSGQVVYAQHARLTGLPADHEYVYVALHDGAQPEFGSFRTAPQRPGGVHLHQLRRPGHADDRQAIRAAGRCDDREPAVRQRQPRLARRRRPARRRGTRTAAVPPVQRRPLLRQPGHRPGPHLVGLLGEQQPQRALPAVDAGPRQPRERAGQRRRSATRRSRPTSRRRRSPVRPT